MTPQYLKAIVETPGALRSGHARPRGWISVRRLRGSGGRNVNLLRWMSRSYWAFFAATLGTVSMIDRIATATMKTLNIRAMIAASRTARLS